MSQSIADLLAAGLEAQDWRETASITANWKRFGKWGRGAMYVILHDCKTCSLGGNEQTCKVGELWFSELHRTSPYVEVIGPMLNQIFDAGSAPIAWNGQRQVKHSIDADAALDELMSNGGSK